MLNPQEYRSCKWIVEANATNQARSDAVNIPYYRINEILHNQHDMVEFMRVLDDWITTDKSDVVLVNISEDYRNKMSDYEKESLKKYWTEVYPWMVLELLRERVKNNVAQRG